jgi:hypothetical protein
MNRLVLSGIAAMAVTGLFGHDPRMAQASESWGAQEQVPLLECETHNFDDLRWIRIVPDPEDAQLLLRIEVDPKGQARDPEPIDAQALVHGIIPLSRFYVDPDTAPDDHTRTLKRLPNQTGPKQKWQLDIVSLPWRINIPIECTAPVGSAPQELDALTTGAR